MEIALTKPMGRALLSFASPAMSTPARILIGAQPFE